MNKTELVEVVSSKAEITKAESQKVVSAVLDAEKEANHDALRAEIFTDRIYPGTYIDNVHVGGMTREQAIREIEAVNDDIDAKFDLVVSIGNFANRLAEVPHHNGWAL